MKTFLFLLISVLCYHLNAQVKNAPKVFKDIEWAKPKGHVLTMDIYVPQTGKKNYPVIIIYHGGSWMINTKSVMDSMSYYLSGNTDYVICNTNYRLLGDLENTVKMNEIVEDALGAFLWVKDNISKYGGDANDIALTGDSAGGHLATMVALGVNKISDGGYGPEKFYFEPTYMPSGQSIDQLKERYLSIRAVMPSYGAFDMVEICKNGFERTLSGSNGGIRGLFGDEISISLSPAYYQAISPYHLIEEASTSPLPPFLLMVGSEDKTTTPASIKHFQDKLARNGHVVEYWEYQGMPHAYLDGHKNDFSGIVTEFMKDGPRAMDVMINFLTRMKE